MLQAYYQASVFRYDGKVVLKGRRYLSRSFVKGFAVCLYRNTASTSGAAQDVGNTSRSVDRSYGRCMCIVAGSGDMSIAYLGAWGSGPISSTFTGETVGIVVGTGTNAVTPTDYAL